MNFKILDCTLRDGGYYNNWNFTLKFANEYNLIIKKAKVDIVEIGFWKKNFLNQKDKLFLYTSKKTLKKIKFDENQVVSIMLDLSDFKKAKDLQYLKNNFPERNKSPVSVVRLACNFEDKNILRPVINILKKKKYLVAVNLMKFTLLKSNLIINFFDCAKKMKVDFFYLADSLGNCKPANLIKLSYALKKKFSITKFGFHAHDNLGYALSNSLTAAKMGFGFIDTSINGMGRGAGNLKLEELLKKEKKQEEYKLIKNFIKNRMCDLKKKYNWGTNLFYKISAKNNIHPTFIQRLMEEKKYNNSIIKSIISYLRETKSSFYDANIFDDLFLNSNSIKKKYYDHDNKEILIIGNASSIVSKKEIIKNKDKSIIATLNYNPKINQELVDCIFICNPYRIITEINLIKNKEIIIPNIKKLYKKKFNKFTFYNISKSSNFSIKKNECSFKKNLVLFYALAFCLSNRFKKIRIINISKNPINNFIIKGIIKYIKKKCLKTKLEFSFV
jgi:4-hydroxy 2-oxovalerate aldolase